MSEPMALQRAGAPVLGKGGSYAPAADVVVAALVWCEIEPLRGFTQITAQQTDRKFSHRVRMYPVAGIAAGMELVHQVDGRVFKIDTVPVAIESGARIEMLVEQDAEANNG